MFRASICPSSGVLGCIRIILLHMVSSTRCCGCGSEEPVCSLVHWCKSDTKLTPVHKTTLLPIFTLAFIYVSFVHGLLYSFHPVFLRSSSCSLLFWHPLQCYLGQPSICHSLNMAVPCELVLFDPFYNCFL